MDYTAKSVDGGTHIVDFDGSIPDRLCREEIIGMSFDSLDDAWDFYNAYAFEKGFSVRCGSTRYSNTGVLVGQQFCCSKEGFKVEIMQKCNHKRGPRSSSRTRCRFSVRVNIKSSGKWVITYCEENHNYDMCDSSKKIYLRSYREIKESDIAEALIIKSVGIRTSQIMNYLTQQAGGYQNIGFVAQDLYNALHACNQAEISNGDVNAVIAYFEMKKESNIGFYMKYDTDDDTRLHNLFWADATSKSDYACFGDVIAFDTTYKKNAYNRPLMPIVGMNHHHKTIVFGVAILADETTDTFEWVLKSFLEAMQHKSPNSVVTNGDRAMQRAIITVISDARHRLCTWHIVRNARANINDSLFMQAFCRCMNSWWTPNEFDREWTSMVKHFNVENHPWVIKNDRTRDMWAQAYITGHFFRTL